MRVLSHGPTGTGGNGGTNGGFHGVGPALVTPMTSDGEVDLDAFATHVEWVMDAGVHFLVPCGTTGESATLTGEEQLRVIRRAVEVAGGRVPVMAGAGTNSTRDAVELARAAAGTGADALLSVSPYYNKPTQEGLFLHYRAVAAAVEIPVFVYNVPGRTSSNVAPATLFRLAEEVENIAGVKEASGDIQQVMTILRDRPAGFSVLSGEDHLTFALMALGGEGVVSVVANEAPGPMATLTDLLREGRLRSARKLHNRLLPLMRANFVETNPIPVKTALEMMGHFDCHLRLPLTPLGSGARDTLREALESVDLLDEAKETA
ncbi:MAG: 4-hydroxy-tetrahydrodipicolinate synthase [Longimicrobiales bacterium]